MEKMEAGNDAYYKEEKEVEGLLPEAGQEDRPPEETEEIEQPGEIGETEQPGETEEIEQPGETGETEQPEDSEETKQPEDDREVEHTDPYETLRELQCGILLWGLLSQLLLGILAVLAFPGQGISLSIGLWVGSITALALARHMLKNLERALDLPEGGAGKKVLFGAMLRYAVILAVLLLLEATKLGNPLSAFLGLMGLKAGAFLQPLTHKWLHRNHKKKEVKL